jgi:hypothetical protein
LAAEYIAAQFRRVGLEPAGDDGYFQNAKYQTVQPSPEGLTFTLGTAKAADGTVSVQEAVAADLNRRLIAWRRAQLDYYENPFRQSSEYPPVLRGD